MQKVKKNVERKKSNFIPLTFHSCSSSDSHLLFKKLLVEKIDKIDKRVTSKTNEEYILVSYGYTRFIDICRFLSSSLDELNTSVIENKHRPLEKFEENFPDNEIVINKFKELQIFMINDLHENESIEINLKSLDEKEKLKDVLCEDSCENTPLKNTKIEFFENWARIFRKKSVYPYK